MKKSSVSARSQRISTAYSAASASTPTKRRTGNAPPRTPPSTLPKGKGQVEDLEPIDIEVPTFVNYDDEIPAPQSPTGPMTIQQREEFNNIQLLERCSFRNYKYDDHFMRPGLEFYKWISCRPDTSSTTNNNRLKMNIPDTIIYGFNKNPIWIYSSPDGFIRRTDSFTESQVLKKLQKFIPTDDSIVAVVKRQDGMTLGKANEVSVVKFTELKAILSPASYPNKSQMVIQGFVRCKGPKAYIVRVHWQKGRAPTAWSITNKLGFEDQSIGAGKGYTIDVNAPSTLSIIKIQGNAIGYLNEQITKLVLHIERTTRPTVAFQEIVVDFLKGADEKWWILQVKAFRLLPVAIDVYRQYLAKQQALPSNVLMNPDMETANGLLKIDMATSSPPTYKKLLQCASCCARYPAPEVVSVVFARTLLEVITHLRRRGKSLPWFDFVEMNLSHKGNIDSYSTLKVCQSCYNLYQMEQKLMEVEQDFANELSLQKPIRLLDSNRVRAEEDDIPADLKGYRLMFYIHELNGLPDLRALYDAKDFALSSTLFGRVIQVPLPAGPKGRLILDNSTIIPIFVSEEMGGITQLFRRFRYFDLQLVASRTNQAFISIPLQLHQFTNPTINKIEMKPVMLARGDSIYFSVRLSVAIAPFDCCDVKLLEGLKIESGAWIPPVGFYTCDPLPEEWVSLLTERHRDADHIFDPPAGAVQLPGSHSLLSPSTRKRMEVKDKTKSVWRFEILLENLHRVDLGMSNARWGMLIVAFDREYEVEVTRGQDDSAVFGNDRFSIFFRGNANSLRKWLEDQAPIEFHLLKV
eukprot:TRINITY_DN6261_c0_g1_i10.p1 TRINITY_DN6261_c0_g1~~TRINITY_DN6261_c0_g1_i10.p1  ORF type:complete len:804 (+),score=150.58 TRINITY_DN6261_c0_g1_i10:55-2466(+)